MTGLSDRSRRRLKGVHPDLVRVVERAAKMTDAPAFAVLEGLRTEQRQAELVEKGKSRTMNSRHLTGHAVDIAPLDGKTVSWDWPLYYPLAKHIKEAARIEGVPIEWGGDWRTFKDGPHWQLPRKLYPAAGSTEPVTDGVVETPKTDAAVKVGGGAAAGGAVITAVSEATDSLGGVQSFFSSDNPILWVVGTLVLVGIGYVLWQRVGKR